MNRSRHAVLGAALVAAALPVPGFAADSHDEPSARPLNLNPAQLRRKDPEAFAAMVAARQRLFGSENVDPKNGRVDKSKVIVSWFSVASFAVAAKGRVFLLDSYIYRIADSRGYVPLLLQDLVDLQPEAIFLGHGHGDHADNAAYISKLTGATIYGAAEHCAAMQGDAGRLFGQGNTVHCVSITPTGEMPGATLRPVSALQPDLCITAFKHLHSGAVAGAPPTTNPINPVRDTRMATLYPTLPAPTLDTRTQAGDGGPIPLMYQFTVAGSDFTFTWHDTAGPIRNSAPQLQPILSSLPKTDVELGAGVSIGETVTGVRDITEYIARLQPKVFYMTHTDNFNPAASFYYLQAIQREFNISDPARPNVIKPEIRGFHDPYDYLRPGLATFDWKDDYWKGSQVPNRASAHCPG